MQATTKAFQDMTHEERLTAGIAAEAAHILDEVLHPDLIPAFEAIAPHTPGHQPTT